MSLLEYLLIEWSKVAAGELGCTGICRRVGSGQGGRCAEEFQIAVFNTEEWYKGLVVVDAWAGFGLDFQLYVVLSEFVKDGLQ